MHTVTSDIVFLEPIQSSQNLVFKARVSGQVCVIRLTSPGHRCLEQLQTELTLLLDLQSVTEITTSPLPFTSGEYIESLSYEGESYNATHFIYVDGVASLSNSYKNGETMGLLLAGLHTAFRKLPGKYALPKMSNVPNPNVLIHGDFNPTNVLFDENIATVIDFENACYSSYEYEVANTIYMSAFDYRRDLSKLLKSGFNQGFLSGYLSSSRLELPLVCELLNLRVAILKTWLDRPAIAPLSIRCSSGSWKQELN